MIRRGISATDFNSLTPHCGFGCVSGALLALACDPRALAGLIIVVVMALCWALGRRNSNLLVSTLVTAGVLATVQYDLAGRWPAQRDGERLVADCELTSLPELSAVGTSFDAACAQRLPRRGASREPRVLRLRVRLPLDAPAQTPRAGEHWQWLLEVRSLSASLNPGAVDAERQWYRERLHGFARVRRSAFTRRLASAPPGLLRLRSSVVDAIAQRVADRDARALIAALAVGATGELTREQWRIFAVTGITHLIAISGMHVTAFAVVAMTLARRMWRALPRRAAARIDRERFAAFIGIAAAIAYAAVAGMSVPTQRTLVMLLIAATARLSSRQIGAAQLLSLAAIAVLLIDPYAPLAAGFWLSFIAVGVLIALGALPLPGSAGEGAARSPASWRDTRLGRGLVAMHEGARLQSLIVVAMAPLTLLLFGSVPLAGLLVNLLAIPLFSFALVPLTLAGVACMPAISHGVDLAAPAWRVVEILWVAAAPALEWAAGLPAALWQPDVSPLWLFASPLLVLAALLPWPASLRGAATLALLGPLLAGARALPGAGQVQATVLDTGQGLAIILRTARHSALYDTADVHGAEGTAVARVVLPALRATGVVRLDRLIVSDLSPSHVIGAAVLTASFPVDQARTAGHWASADITTLPCSPAEHWDWDGVQFSWLDAGVSSPCVLRLATGRHVMLLTGSLDTSGEQLLLRDPAALRAEVIIVPRHGSTMASSAEFVSAVQPRLAIVVAGAGVASQVVDRWRAAGAQWFSTQRCGALQLSLSASGVALPVARFADGWQWPWRARCPRQ